MLHIIEHLGHPRSALEKIEEILRPGGILVIETPRFDTIWFRLLRHRERSVIQDHTYYFTRKSLSEMIRRTGLSVSRLDSVGRTLTLDRLGYNFAKVVNLKSFSRLLIRTSDRLHLHRYSIHLNFRDMMRLFARKPFE
jgi:predicted SAM-dependent methyltransferase